jgi:hypothetical protein
MNFIYLFILSTVFFGVIGVGLVLIGESGIKGKDYFMTMGKKIIPISGLFFCLSIVSSGEWVMIGLLFAVFVGLCIINWFIIGNPFPNFINNAINTASVIRSMIL